MGKKVGKYELGKTLGSGNFSKVKLGTDSETGAQFAVKIIDKQQLVKEHMEEQLKREIAVMKVLKHPGVVQLVEVMQTVNHIYLVLELVTGGELFDKIVAAKRFSESIARDYFHQLIMAIQYCHQQGIAHRDLKPENLLLDANNKLKVTDFGLSNLQRGGARGQGTLLQTVCGTPNYVAPEVLKEKGYNGMMADVWSCGVVLFVMMAGYLPFDDPNLNALFNKIERGEYRMARHFSESSVDLISKMLTVDPDQRLTIEQVIAHPWFQVDFDMNKWKQYHVAVKVSDGEVQGAISNTTESSSSASAGAAKTGSGASSDKAQAARPTGAKDSGVDAFDIISRLSAGALNPLFSSANASLVQSNTRFLMKGSQEDFTTVLAKLSGNPKTKDDTTEIKGFWNAPKGLMTYTANVVKTSVSGLSLIELRRGRGDVLEFHEFYRKVITELGSKVCSGEIAN